MFRSIWEDIKQQFSYGNMVTRLIIINVAFFVFINLVWVVMRLSHAYETPEAYYSFLHFFLISSDWWHNLTHPWVIVTNMFAHEEFWHIIFNMLFLYSFGRIVGDFIGDHRLLALYLLGGLAGGLAFFVSANVMGYGGGTIHFALGASAAVMAIVLAAGIIAPDYEMRLLLLGDVKLKYIAGALLLIDIIGIGSNINTGGRVAHLGGALMGWLFVSQLRSGNDLSEPVNRLLERIQALFQRRPVARKGRGRGPRVVYRNTEGTTTTGSRPTRPAPSDSTRSSASGGLSHQEQLDAILDKIKETGYDSLTKEEKEFLFNASDN